MSTRGAIGWRIDGQDKLSYNHSDSYPTYLLAESIGPYCQKTEFNDEYKNRVRNLRLVDEDTPPTAEDIKNARQRGTVNLHVSNQSETDWYCLLRGSQGDLAMHLADGVMLDYSDFVKHGLFCEWAYIINLDEGLLEIYEGRNYWPDGEGRYASETDEDAPNHYGVRLIKTIPLKSCKRFYPKRWNDLATKLEKGDDDFEVEGKTMFEWENDLGNMIRSRSYTPNTGEYDGTIPVRASLEMSRLELQGIDIKVEKTTWGDGRVILRRSKNAIGKRFMPEVPKLGG